MATYDLSGGGTTVPVTYRGSYTMERTVDISEVNNGAGVAAADVLRVLQIPAESVVLDAGFEVITAVVGTSPDIDFGITGGDVDEWVDGNNGTVGYATRAVPSPQHVAFVTADTLDLLFNTNAATAGVIRCFALVYDTKGIRETDPNTATAHNTPV